MADHQLHELVRRRGRRQPGGGGAPVAENRHLIADPADLVEAVGDVDHPDALGSQAPDDSEECLDLTFIENRRRLVHDEQPRVM